MNMMQNQMQPVVKMVQQEVQKAVQKEVKKVTGKICFFLIRSPKLLFLDKFMPMMEVQSSAAVTTAGALLLANYVF